jgi:hypothetical protein
MIEATPLPEPAYRVKIKNGNNRATYRYFINRRKAVRFVSWHMIWEKYRPFPGTTPQETAPFPSRFECTCDNAEWGTGVDWIGCEVHDRRDGYFSRLAERIARWIEAGYMPGTGFAP